METALQSHGLALISDHLVGEPKEFIIGKYYFTTTLREIQATRPN
jgi:hypothetical protein